MTLKSKTKKTFARFLKDTTGHFGMIWAISGTAVVFAVGTAYDVSQVTSAKRIAQTVADHMALTASIAIDTDNEDRYIEGQIYPYQQLSGPTHDFTNSIKGSVEYDVDDDGDDTDNLLARTTVTGSYKPAFMGAIGVKAIPFHATSDVTYAQAETSPASVFLVLDNSGSMNFDDKIDTVTADDYYQRVSNTPDAQPRIDGLKTIVKSLMVTLEEVVDSVEPGEPRVLRTAMWPYESDVNTTRVLPQWGVIDEANIDAMVAEGGTNSFNSMNEAWTELQKEAAIHREENKSTTQLKYVIFMTDGVNDLCINEAKPGHYHWRIWSWWYRRWFISETQRDQGWEKVWVNDGVEETRTCSNSSPFDQTTIDVCTAMIAAGVEVYTIGYSLAPGRYHRNDGINYWANTDYDRYHYVLESEVSQTAYSVLGSCANTPNHFKLAEDADALALVFKEIGEEVIKDVIRVKS